MKGVEYLTAETEMTEDVIFVGDEAVKQYIKKILIEDSDDEATEE